MSRKSAPATEEVHALVDRLQEADLPTARRVLKALVESSEDDEEPLSPKLPAESEAAWQDYLSGRDPGTPLKEVERELQAERRG